MLEDLGSLGCTVHDVAFAPTMGRTYYLLAAACSDKKVRIWKITSLSVNSTTSGAVPRTQYEYEEEEMLPFAEAQAGNVSPRPPNPLLSLGVIAVFLMEPAPSLA